MCLDINNISHIRIHKEQFNEIENKGKYIMLSCAEDGRVLVFNRNADLSPVSNLENKGE